MSYSSEVLADSPLVWWRFGDGSGTTAADSSGNSRPATWNVAPTYVSGLIVGDADGAIKPNAHFASLADAAWMDVSALTVEAWVNYDTLVAGSGIVDRYDNGAVGVSSFLFWTPSNKFSFAIRDNVGDKSATDTATIATGTKYHVVGTCDGSNVKLYVNNTLVSTVACGPLAAGSAAIVTAMTVFNGGVAAGTVDEVAVYGTALSTARITAHYQAGTGTTPPSGTGSLALSGSGIAQVTAAGSAALSLSGSGAAKAVATGTGSLALTGSGVIDFQPASGTGSLALSGAGAAGIGASGSGAITLSGAGTAVGSMAATGTGSLTLLGSGSATLADSGTAFLTLAATGAAEALYVTDVSNLLNGRNRRAVATSTVTRPAAATPSRAAVKYDKSVPYPPPTLVNGRPT